MTTGLFEKLHRVLFVTIEGIENLTFDRADGSFTVSDLASGRYNVVAIGNSGFAFAPGVPIGADQIELVLQPAGRLAILVQGSSGAPVEGAIVAVIAVNGRRFRGAQSVADTEGKLELFVPGGTLQLKSVKGNELQGLGAARVDPGGTATASITLELIRR